jgi:hypothetical protein
MKEIVLVTLAVDMKTGRIDRGAPFMVNSRSRRGTRYNVTTGPTKMSQE